MTRVVAVEGAVTPGVDLRAWYDNKGGDVIPADPNERTAQHRWIIALITGAWKFVGLIEGEDVAEMRAKGAIGWIIDNVPLERMGQISAGNRRVGLGSSRCERSVMKKGSQLRTMDAHGKMDEENLPYFLTFETLEGLCPPIFDIGVVTILTLAMWNCFD